MEMAPSIRDRIFSAADALYEEAGRLAFPTVDTVRKRARVNMNDASVGMKAWRRAQTAQVVPMAVQVPNTLQQTSATALTALWSEAVTLANESLRAAQAGWDTERAEAEALSEQMANAFETQATELAAAQSEIARLQSEIERANDSLACMQRRSEDMLREIAIANAATKQAEARVVEIERRADELRKELDHAHLTAAETSKEFAAMRLSNDNEIETLRSELLRIQQKAELDTSTAQAALSEAREANATLRGKLDAIGEKAAQPSKPHAKAKKLSDGDATK